MARPPKYYIHNNKIYSTNCIKLNHKQCWNYFSKCECGCHTGDFDPTVKELRNKLAREKYADLTQQQLKKRNGKIKHMREIGKWKGHN